MTDWKSAVWTAVCRQAALREDGTFTRKDLIDSQLDYIVEQVGSAGKTPEQTLSRELQELAESGKIRFLDNKGTYKIVEENFIGNDVVARIDIDGFRSLRKFSIFLDRGLNALVGPNGAGKTNFIDFLDFLSTLVTRDASSAVSISGGVGRVFSQEDNKRVSPRVSARICGVADLSSQVFDPEDRTLFRFEYYVEVRFSKSHSAIYIPVERIKFFALHSRNEIDMPDRLIGTINLRRRSPLAEIDPAISVSPKLLTTGLRNPLRYLRRTPAPSSSPRLQRSDNEFVITNAPGPDESLLAVRPIRPAMEAIRSSVSRGRAFNLDPSRAREPDEITRMPAISPDGSGLSAMLYHLYQLKKKSPSRYIYSSRHDSESLDSIIEWTKLVLPELQDISVSADPHSGKYIAYLVVGNNDRAIRIPLQSASDGTIKWLAFVAMILGRGSTYSIEEPENYLHPRMQQFLISLIRENVDESKPSNYFILSTHSETIINQLDPSELIVFEFRDGSTICRRLQNSKSVAEQINETGFGLGHFYAANALS